MTESFRTEAQNETVQRLLTSARQRLVAAGCDTPQLDAEVLLAHVLGRDRTWLISHPAANLTPHERDSFLKLVERRVKREPVAYLVGYKAFYGLDFVVTPDTLIPRPATELLVETAIQLATAVLSSPGSSTSIRESQKSKYSIIDVGTGSGCIAVALAKALSQTSVKAIDLSGPALAVARQNAARYGVADRIEFLQGDLLAPSGEPVDMIVSNPPYVDPLDLVTPVTTPEVNYYEPRLALDGGQSGLDVVRRLLAQATAYLKPGGMVLVEIGATQGIVVKNLAQAKFPTAVIEVKPDLAGLDRLLVVKKRVD